MDKVIIFADHQIGFDITQLILQWEASGKEAFTIEAIFTNKQPQDAWWNPIRDLNDNWNTPIYEYDPEFAYNFVNGIQCDFLLLLSWRHIVPDKILKCIRKNSINLHYSLLPLHRGVYPVNWAIQAGDEKTGITFHIVTSGIDTGAIIDQKEIKIQPTDNAKTLLTKLDKLAIKRFSYIWQIRDKWDNISYEQKGKTSYHSKKDFIETNRIDPSKTYRAAELINLLRGKTFRKEGSSAYFVDPKTDIKYSVSIKIKELKN